MPNELVQWLAHRIQYALILQRMTSACLRLMAGSGFVILRSFVAALAGLKSYTSHSWGHEHASPTKTFLGT